MPFLSGRCLRCPTHSSPCSSLIFFNLVRSSRSFTRISKVSDQNGVNFPRASFACAHGKSLLMFFLQVSQVTTSSLWTRRSFFLNPHSQRKSKTLYIGPSHWSPSFCFSFSNWSRNDWLLICIINIIFSVHIA